MYPSLLKTKHAQPLQRHNSSSVSFITVYSEPTPARRERGIDTPLRVNVPNEAGSKEPQYHRYSLFLHQHPVNRRGAGYCYRY